MAYRKPGAKRSPAQRAADYAFERECDSAGMSHEEIAAELSRIRPYTLTRQSVDTDFKKVFALYRNAAVADLTAHRQREIEIAEWLYRDLMRQWKRSCQDATTNTLEIAVGPDGKPLPTPVPAKGAKGPATPEAKPGKHRATKKGQCGDSSLAGRIVDVRARIAKLRGLDAPEKSETVLTGKDGGPVEVEHADKRPIDFVAVAAELRGMFAVPQGNGNGQPLHPTHADAQAGAVSGPAKP